MVLASALGAWGRARQGCGQGHYEAGTRLYDIHECEAALKKYKAGYLRRPDPSFLYNIGKCYKRHPKP